MNNTVSGNAIGISVNSSASTIHYNNIQGNLQNSIYLFTSDDVNATDNWWGTTYTQAINQSIHDLKADLSLGTVIFVPFLTTPNSQASPISATSQSPISTPTESGNSSNPNLSPSPSIPEMLPMLTLGAVACATAHSRKRRHTT